MFVVSVLTEHTPTLFELHVSSLLHLFGSVLSKPENHGTPLGYLTVVCMKNVLQYYPKKDKTVNMRISFFFRLFIRTLDKFDHFRSLKVLNT